MKLPNLSQEETNKLLPFDSILTGYVGSIAHNTYIPQEEEHGTDDKDIMSVYISPIEKYLGVASYGDRDRGTVQRMYNEWDSVAYDVRKYVHLLIKGNPNVQALLWLKPNHYVYISELGQRLLDNRMLFVSKQAYRAFLGYSHGQLKRMTHFKFEGYQGEKRKKLVEKYGFDCKNASHLIRIMRMCIEFLNEGQLYVFRDDSEELIAIKKWEWTLEKVKEEADRLFRRAEDVYDRCALPTLPNVEQAEKLVIDIIMDYFNLKK